MIRFTTSTTSTAAWRASGPPAHERGGATTLRRVASVLVGTPRTARTVGLLATVVALVATSCVRPGGGRGHGNVRPREAPRVVTQWSRFDAGVDVAPVPSNPFDPNVIDVEAIFVDPHGKAWRAIGFWFQDYTRALVDNQEQLTPNGTPYFAIRFTPTVPGNWTWSWHVRTATTDVTTRPRRLFVRPHEARGYVRLSKTDPRYLAFDNGAPYFAVGENLAWYDNKRGTYWYDSWLDQLAAQHVNYARLWMPSWAFGIEWNDTGLGNYTNRLPNAWQLDQVFSEARQRGIYIELSLLNHGAFSTVFNSEWAANPYNAANGGPLATPSAFFTDPTARKFFEQRLRYIVARWGYATNLLSWELWNEVDLTDNYNSTAVTSWHQTMSAYLRDLDPNRHLVTSSEAIYANDPNLWANGGLDYTQLHFYSNPIGWFPDLSQDVVSFSKDRIAQTGKPVLFAELGAASGGSAQQEADDPNGISVHDGLWAGVVSQGIGTAMTWWWDTLIDAQPDLYYPMFGSVARFVSGVQWDREGFEPIDATATTTTNRPLVAYNLWGHTTALLWLKDDAYQFATPQQVDIGDAKLTLDAPGTRQWCGSWYDTWTGTAVQQATFPSGTTTIDVPPFHGDIALRVHACR
jgi:Domain of unknown function (DUF5060)